MLRISATLLLLAAPFLALAADPAAPASGISDMNVTSFSLTLLIVILVLANVLLAYILRQLGSAVKDKVRKGGKAAAKAGAMLVLMLCSLTSFAQDADGAAEAAPAEVVSPYIAGMLRTEFYSFMTIIGFLLVVMLILILLIRMLLREVRGIPQAVWEPKPLFTRRFLDYFNKSVPVQQEAAIELDHEYDGIRELDNDLPPWWKYMFIATIISSVLYLGYYHVLGGPNQEQEYLAAVEKGEREKAAYLAKNEANVDENTVTMVLDPGELSGAKALYETHCAACHAADGGGGVGPNLTDDYWIHGGTINKVFYSIKYGWPDKGMKSWKDDFSPQQIAALSSYVKTLHGTKPAAPKEPQGDKMVEGGDNALDSVSNATDPSLTPVGGTENKDNSVGPFDNKADGKGLGTPAGK